MVTTRGRQKAVFSPVSEGILCLAGGVNMNGKRVPVSHEGNAALFEAIILSIASTFTGHPIHLHAEGLRGTGKTTVLRWAKNILPKIERIRGCVYNCDPADPHCPIHRGLTRSEIDALGTEWVPMPFMEISHSAKLGTVVGSLDLEKLIDSSCPEAAFLPGTIPRAHRGIILVDEVNRLAETAPEITDVLLGVMGTRPGWIKLEEAGLPQFELPVRVSVWAASNPDEDPGPLGDIRRQLADRFDLLVAITRPTSVDDVLRILDEVLTEGAWVRRDGGDPKAFPGYSLDLNLKPSKVAITVVPDKIRRVVAQLYVDFGIESLRAVEAMLRVARTRAAIEERNEVSITDLLVVAPLALRHRVDLQVVPKILEFLSGLNEASVTRMPAGTIGRPGYPESSKRSAGSLTNEQRTGSLSSEKVTNTPPLRFDRPTLAVADKTGRMRKRALPLHRVLNLGSSILELFRNALPSTPSKNSGKSPSRSQGLKTSQFSSKGRAPGPEEFRDKGFWERRAKRKNGNGVTRQNPVASGSSLSFSVRSRNEVTSPPIPGKPLFQLPPEAWLVPEAELRDGLPSTGDDG